MHVPLLKGDIRTFSDFRNNSVSDGNGNGLDNLVAPQYTAMISWAKMRQRRTQERNKEERDINKRANGERRKQIKENEITQNQNK